MSLLAELQRRQVLKVGATYLVVGWLAVQAASIAFPTFDAPPWALRVFIFVTLLGFPVALIMAWVLQVTPDGVRVETAASGRKRLYAAAALLAALAVAWYFVGQPAVRDDVGDTQSIAVLPFVNMSSDPAQDYFSDGISEEILNALAQMQGLKVAARTSSFSFKDQNREIPDIARELAVRMILEGSVRKQGDRVRITAQLIDARNGFHVWSRTYDRDLKDIFAIQDEIARAIAQQLEVELGIAQSSDEGRADTADLAAYDMYLKGMQLWQARGYDNMLEARRLFKAAVARDPKFAKAWAGLALSETLALDWLGEPSAEALPRARDAGERALAFDPLLPEAYAALANTASYEGRYETAWALFERAIAISPSYATAWHWYGFNLSMSYRAEDGIAKSNRAVELDPKSTIVRFDRLIVLYNLGPERDEEVIRECRALLGERPEWSNCGLLIVNLLMQRKQYAAARPFLLELAKPRGPEAVRLANEMIDALEGQRDPRPIAARLLPLTDGAVDPSSLTPLDDNTVVWWFLSAGLTDQAFLRFARLAGERPSILRANIVDPRFDPWRCRADFRAAVAMAGFEDLRATQLCSTRGSR